MLWQKKKKTWGRLSSNDSKQWKQIFPGENSVDSCLTPFANISEVPSCYISFLIPGTCIYNINRQINWYQKLTYNSREHIYIGTLEISADSSKPALQFQLRISQNQERSLLLPNGGTHVLLLLGGGVEFAMINVENKEPRTLEEVSAVSRLSQIPSLSQILSDSDLVIEALDWILNSINWISQCSVD